MAAALGSTSVSAVSRDTLRRSIQTSMMGRLSGFDRRGYEVGEEDTRLPIDNIGTTAASTLTANGVSVLSCTAASSAIYTIDSVGGIYKQITQISSSTAGFQVQFGANAHVVSTLGTSFNQLVFAGLGHTANLFCVSTGSTDGNAGGVWLLTTAFTTAGGMSASTY